MDAMASWVRDFTRLKARKTALAAVGLRILFGLELRILFWGSKTEGYAS